MKEGTRSVLFGCHSPVHSVMVTLAFRKIHKRWPKPWELVCIFLHDIGHWGKDYLTYESEKRRHWELGAKVAKKLFGDRGYDLAAGHCPNQSGKPKSILHDPDKYSWIIAPTIWLMSNTIPEPKLIRPGNSRRESAVMFKNEMLKNMADNYKRTGHDIYIEQWGRANAVR